MSETDPAEWIEIGTRPFVKDYDAVEAERPANLPFHLKGARMALLSSHIGGERTGGAIVAVDCPDLKILGGRSDVAALVDLRVATSFRRRGLGAALFERACAWSRAQACSEIRVETQDTNPAACRFYRSLGCTLYSLESGAYGAGCDETKVVWTYSLTRSLLH